MKNPIKTSKDKILDAYEAEVIKACCPDGNIPNSRVANQIDRARGNAVLRYAKSQNRPVRRAKMGECEYSMLAKPKAYQKVDINKPAGMLTTKEAAERIGINIAALQQRKKNQQITPTKIGARNYYSEAEIQRFKSARKKAA